MFSAILHNAPGWVWILLAVLIALGIWLSFPRRMTLRRATIVPMLLLLWSLVGVVSTFGAPSFGLAGWGAGIAAALLLTAASGAWSRIHWSSADSRLVVPGSWAPMLLIMGVFFTKFAVAATLSTQPALKLDPVFATWVGLAYGSFSGLFLGRTTVMWKVARQALQPRG